MSDEVLASQIAYYRARAPMYDDWWFRRGRYDLGKVFRDSWNAQIEIVRAALGEIAPLGEVLEFAGGTGNWTRELSDPSDSVTVVDASPEAIEVAKEKISSGKVSWLLRDIFEYRPDRLYATVFFSFWLSHVPLDRFDHFWTLVEKCLRPGGRVFFIDNAHPELAISSTPESYGSNLVAEGKSVRGIDSVTDLETGIAKRLTADGRVYDVIKIWWRPDELRTRLAQLGWDARPRTTQWAFIYGIASRLVAPIDQ